MVADFSMLVVESVDQSSIWPAHLDPGVVDSSGVSFEAQKVASSFEVTVLKKSSRIFVQVGEMCTFKDVNGRFLSIMWVPKCREVEKMASTFSKRAKLQVQHSGFGQSESDDSD